MVFGDQDVKTIYRDHNFAGAVFFVAGFRFSVWDHQGHRS
jgi:hypothetical protein